MNKRRQLLSLATAALAWPGVARAAPPDTLASLPGLRILVPTLAGGTIDLLARVLAQWFGQSHKLQVTVLNLDGASGEIALRRLITEPADGRTWLLAQESLITINPSFYPRPSTDILDGIVPLALIATSSFYMLLRVDDNISSFRDLLRESRSVSVPLPYGSGGVGTLHHLSMEGLAANLDLKLLHVPYKGNAQAVQALVRGEIRVLLAGTSALPLVDAGRLKMVAVSGPRRMAAYPDIPALNEFVPGFQPTNWFGLFARKGVPDSVLGEMRELLRQSLDSDEVRNTVRDRGNVDTGFANGRAFTDLIMGDRQRYAEIAQRLALPKRP